MKKDKIEEIISEIDGKYIDEAIIYEKSPASRPRALRRILAAAACIALIAAIGSGAYAFAAEAKEYNTAVTFFNENGLSTEGLSRSEIKAVYRDITAESFTYSRTADVIRQAVPGWEIDQAEPTPEELANIWNRNVWAYPLTSNDGISYRVESKYVRDEEKGFDVLEKCILNCYENGELLWSADFSDFYVLDHAKTKEGTILWGYDSIFSRAETMYGWVAFVDDAGNIKWQTRLEHGFHFENVVSVLDDGDGNWAVISKGDANYFCFSRLDADGKEIYVRKTEMNNTAFRKVARLGDGYIVQAVDITSLDNMSLLKIDHDGGVAGSYTYESDDCTYHLTDMIEFGGHIYLSAYAVPIQKDEGGRDEIANILDFVFSKSEKGVYADIPSEELTPVVRGNYTAVLLLCDPDGGQPKTFYSVKGSLGGKLAESGEGQLEWDVESVTSTFFSPATSSFTIGGSCKVFRYTFDESGKLISQTDTGEATPYRR